MKVRGVMVLWALSALAAAAITVLAYQQVGVAAQSDGQTGTVVDANGNLRVPPNYRSTYEYLGSWAVAADAGQGAKQLHEVYASPGTIDAYRRDGRFPDGMVLVKEVFQTATGQMTTGTVSRADSLKGWFVMVKDTMGRHSGNKLWGVGWGWSWFDAANRSKTINELQDELSSLPCACPSF